MYPVIEDVVVDIPALLSIAHSCDPLICTSSGSCCGSFEICVEADEMDRVVGFMPMASEFSEGLMSGGSFRNVFEELEPGLFAIDAGESGICVFGYHGAKDEVLCSLHSVAMQRNYKPEEVKPKGCVLWPLALSEDKPLSLSVDSEAFLFPCNKQQKGASRLDMGIADIIKKLFGRAFLDQINEYAAGTACLKR
ncbi:MAG: hypothetical protein ISR97_01325 [Nitrospira sp.]|nr:hypothetical protein [Nitrospira sp.]